MKFQNLLARAYKHATLVALRNSRKYQARFRRAADG
jgi:hypothetical protein